MTDNEGPSWFQAMSRGDLGKLEEELRGLPNIDKAWYTAPGWCTYNPLGWAAFMFYVDLRILQCVLDAGANPDTGCRWSPERMVPYPSILRYLEDEIDAPYEDYVQQTDVVQTLVKNGADYRDTVFEPFAKQLLKRNCAVVWCFANVLPLGARDIAFDFLKRFQELPWGEFSGTGSKRLKST